MLRSGPSVSSADGRCGLILLPVICDWKGAHFLHQLSRDVLLGNFMDSHHSHSHHPLWVLGYWGALSVMWVAEHLRKTVEPIP